MRKSRSFWGQLLLPIIQKVPVVWDPLQTTEKWSRNSLSGLHTKPPAPNSCVAHPHFCHHPVWEGGLWFGSSNQKTEKGLILWATQTSNPVFRHVFLFRLSQSQERIMPCIFLKSNMQHKIKSIFFFFSAKPSAAFPGQLSAAHKINTIHVHPPSSKSIVTWLWINGQVVLPNRAWTSSFFLPGRKEED